MQHIFGIQRELSKHEVMQVSGGSIRERIPPFTTLAIGEEGGGVTTLALGEEGGRATTLAVGEEGGDQYTTLALGEEGGSY